MCVNCEIPSSHKDAFYSENPEIKKAKEKGDILYLQINIVGDAQCGKTSLIDAYQAEKFPSITAVSRYARYKLTKINNMPVEMIFYDTIGLEDYDVDVQKRSLMFMFSEISILCYSVDSRESFEKISSQWWPELQASLTKLKKPYILVGLKKDLRSTKRDNEKSLCVTTNEGKALAKSIGAMSFIECSSVNKEGINQVFETAISKQYQEWRKMKNNSQAWKCLCCWKLNDSK